MCCPYLPQFCYYLQKKNPNELDRKIMKVKPCYAIGIGMRHIEINYMTTGCDILVFR